MMPEWRERDNRQTTHHLQMKRPTGGRPLNFAQQKMGERKWWIVHPILGKFWWQGIWRDENESHHLFQLAPIFLWHGLYCAKIYRYFTWTPAKTNMNDKNYPLRCVSPRVHVSPCVLASVGKFGEAQIRGTSRCCRVSARPCSDNFEKSHSLQLILLSSELGGRVFCCSLNLFLSESNPPLCGNLYFVVPHSFVVTHGRSPLWDMWAKWGRCSTNFRLDYVRMRVMGRITHLGWRW